MTKETINKKLYYKFEMSLAITTPYRAIFYNIEDLPLVHSLASHDRILAMINSLKVNRPYEVWYGSEIFGYLPYIGDRVG